MKPRKQKIGVAEDSGAKNMPETEGQCPQIGGGRCQIRPTEAIGPMKSRKREHFAPTRKSGGENLPGTIGQDDELEDPKTKLVAAGLMKLP